MHAHQRLFAAAGAALLLAGCATFKELEPAPPLRPQERGYVELKNDKENFRLEKDGKYFIKFPRPDRSAFFLVLRTGEKRSVEAYLTDRFDDGKPPIERIPDGAGASDTLFVYEVDSTRAMYYWVIDSVKWDTDLAMTYRYVPRWRYVFENRYRGFRQTLAEVRVDRATYRAISPSFNLDGFSFSEELAMLDSRSRALGSLRQEIQGVDSLFPPELAGSADTAYVRFQELRRETEDEAKFQEDYRATLGFFDRERDTRGNTQAFLEAAPQFAAFLGQARRFPAPVLEKARGVITPRLGEAFPYYDRALRRKNDVQRIALKPPVSAAEQLAAACGQAPAAELKDLGGFVARFNAEADGLQAVARDLAALDRFLDANRAWGSDSLFQDVVDKLARVKARVPEHQSGGWQRFRGYPCTIQMGQEIAKAQRRVAATDALYAGGQRVLRSMDAGQWASAEGGLRAVAGAETPGEFPSLLAQRSRLVDQLEEQLFARVRAGSVRRAEEFARRNVMTLDDVPALYRDSAFVPLHRISFSAKGGGEISRRNGQIDGELAKVRTVAFPEEAIKAVYQELTRSPATRGAEKARAVVDHGREYRGTDKQVRTLVEECDPTVPKWISKPRDYRRVFALPVTANREGTNQYMFRIRLQIPSDAQFPVFDVNVKLPRELAEKAGQRQWYDDITINKTPIRNEGRFRITAPTSANDYESLITPVQMDKAGANVLEVRFTFPGYRAFEVSAMAQVPIIRKN